ncbi:MAG: efflux RND transporter permease subunit [Carboxylicivirga sp.]|jgi:HAE1 family hydrophobic/amphiphilic exporter-1|nr:efflux RND transporter permease subunit [Carboxylicivirga sp.]
MNFQIFIKRLVLSSVISILILLGGFISLNQLPVTQYPDIAPPSVMVTASYPGANAETIRESVIIPIEEQINGVEGMTYIQSTASNDGSASITVYFKQGTDPDIAAVNVQNRVASATPNLPAIVNTYGVKTEKVINSAIMYLSLLSENTDYDETFLMNYLSINIKPELLRINGISRVSIFGARDYAMRIWISPEKMAAYKLSPNEILAAIREQSQEVATGALGQNAGEAFEYVIKYKGRFKTAEEYENIVLNAGAKGGVLLLKDVADIELGAFTYSSAGYSDGNPAVSFGIFQTPGSNAQEIARNIYSELDRLSDRMPEGVKVEAEFDTNKFLEASLEKVKSSLYMAFILVILVMFLFLQDWRATVVPSIAVPVAIIGTFFFLQIAGFSLNLLTLFAMILAIGIVVDNAIVVVEAVYTKLQSGAKDARQATLDAMNEITGALISGTLVMVAVFLPITFLEGPSGIFYKQFGVILIISIAISAVNALTLSPALTAWLMKPHKEMENKSFVQRFFMAFNSGLELFTNSYMSKVRFLFKHKWISVAILLLAGVAIYFSSMFMPKGFVPTEDQSVIFVNVDLPEGASMDRTKALCDKLQATFKQVDGVKGSTMISGNNFFSGAGSSYAMGFIKLDDWDLRTEEHLSIDAIMGSLFYLVEGIPEANIVFFTPGSIPGFGDMSGVEAQLLSLGDAPNEAFDRVAQNYIQKLMADPSLAFVSNSFNIRFPQYDMQVNVAKAKEAGVAVGEIFTAMQAYIGGAYAGDFNRFGKQYRVMVQSKPEDRNEHKSLNKIMVKNNRGEMAPLTEFIDLKKVNGPQTTKRFNLRNSITLNGIIMWGHSSGDAIKTVQDLAKTELPKDYEVVFSGLTREEVIAGDKATIIFLLSLAFVYLLLAAQYESFVLPFAIIIPMVIGVAGAFATNMARGLDNNIFFQIGLIMLIGLLAKNAILIVEFSLQKRREGMNLIESALEGARLRLRPILMTSLTFIIGLMPLVFAGGVGAKGNQSIGTGAAGGMLIGTLVGILVIPALFVFFQYLQEKVKSKSIEDND